jgi:hypothetical protein
VTRLRCGNVSHDPRRRWVIGILREVRMLRWAWLAMLVVGCGGDDESTHEDLGPVCTELAEACHEDGASDEAIACHEVGHEGDEAACEAELDACLETCGA